MATLFISDLHLSEQRPDKLALFQRFIAGPARSAEALYILGDLFEVWIGDDHLSRLNRCVLESLASLRSGDTRLYVMQGNRDFLIGQRFTQMAACELISDPHLVDLYGVQTLLMHGDTLCTQDVDYQAFRRKVRDPAWQRKAMRAPLWLRKLMALKYRLTSKRAMREKTYEVMDVDQDAVESAMSACGASRLIHGHTHRPDMHRFGIDGQCVERIVLGDWYVKDSVLVVEQEGCRLLRIADYLAAS